MTTRARETSYSIACMIWFAVACLWAVQVVSVARAAETWPLQCAPVSAASGMTKAGSCSCETMDELKCDAGDEGGFDLADGTLNVVVVVADDHGYCQYGFMHGYCAASGELCRNNFDCGLDPEGRPLDLCIDNRDPSKGPLRLSDWTCRYRQPPSERKSVKACEGVFNGGADKGDEKGAFPFDHNSFPCPHTTETPSGKFSIPLTPNLDRLASQGVLFTRAHVSGNSCKPSRASMTYGMHHRHMSQIGQLSEEPATVASWVSDADNSYARVIWGKGEIVGVTGDTDGDPTAVPGYQAGKTSSGPAQGRYKCTPNPAEGECSPAENPCCGATKDATDNVASVLNGAIPAPNADIPDIPDVARRGRSALERMLSEVFEQGVIESGSVVQDGDDKGKCPGGNCTSKQNRPFFLWYAPKQPHKGGAGQSYRPLYDGLGKKVRSHFGRVSQIDAVVGALEDELKRSCVCYKDGAGRRKGSLWERTVILYMADHGLFLPKAKHNWSENNHRGPLILSAPRHRDGSDGPRLYEHELASSIDLVQTVIQYVREGDGGVPVAASFPDNPIEWGSSKSSRGYKFARNLKPFAESQKSRLREVLYGEEAHAETKGVATSPNRSRYMIPRPGNIGICVDSGSALSTGVEVEFRPGAGFEHVKLCADSEDCPVGVCEKWALTAGSDPNVGPTMGKRCVNRPDEMCVSHADCAPTCGASGFCESACDPNDPQCVISGTTFGSLADFAPDRIQHDWDRSQVLELGFSARACPLGNSDCLPQEPTGGGLGLCQPVVLKFEKSGSASGKLMAWDLNWDPDQTRDLLDAGEGASHGEYLGSLKGRLEACLEEFFDFNVTLGTPTPTPGTPQQQPDCPWHEDDPLAS